jgi:hypothetical protein
MIPKPTTREQVLRNAILAAEACQADIDDQRSAAPSSRAALARAWATIASMLPEADSEADHEDWCEGCNAPHQMKSKIEEPPTTMDSIPFGLGPGKQFQTIDAYGKVYTWEVNEWGGVGLCHDNGARMTTGANPAEDVRDDRMNPADAVNVLRALVAGRLAWSDSGKMVMNLTDFNRYTMMDLVVDVRGNIITVRLAEPEKAVE